MKKIIDGKVYDTGKAKAVGQWNNGHYTNDLEYCSETLYQKKTGEFFLHGKGHALSKYATHSGNTDGWGEKIIPLSYVNAQKWAEEHLDDSEYIRLFGAPEEDGARQAVTLRLSKTAYRKAKQNAAQQGTTLQAYIESLIKK